MKKILLFFTCLLFAGGVLWAQNIRVTGIVTDAGDGQPLVGVSVLVKNSQTITSTGIDGRYTINVPNSASVLQFSYIGYKPFETTVGDRATINVQLETDALALEEVVVTGYGVVRTRNTMGGASSNIKGETIIAAPTVSFDEALQGRMAGVQVTTASGLLADGTSIRVRGTNSISLSSQPLFVIDGVPVMETTNLNVFNSGNGTRFNPMATINQNDVESIEVLKDAAAAALYGSRAANGVILITTKRGKAGQARVSYSTYLGWSQPVNLPKFLNAEQFMSIQNEAASNYFKTAGGDVVAAPMYVDGKMVETDWMKLAFRTGFSQSHSVSASGGTDKISFFGSADWMNQDGIVVNNWIDRYAFRANVEARANKWIKAGVSVSYTNTKGNGQLSDGYLAGITIAAYLAMPNVPEKRADGSYATVTDNDIRSGTNNGSAFGLLHPGNNRISYLGNTLTGNSIYHPTGTAFLQRNSTRDDRLLGNAYVEFTPFKGLAFTSKLGVDNLNHLEDQYSHPSIAGLGRSFTGLVQENIVSIRQWNWQTYANYKIDLGAHKINAMAGLEYQERNYQDWYVGAAEFISEDFQHILDGTFTNEDNFSGGSMNARGFMSYFANLGYSFMDKYYLDASFRADGYSGFGKDNKFGYFPGVSAAWRISEESFMKGTKSWLFGLKLRASWGLVGNSNFNPYNNRSLYAGAPYTTVSGLRLSSSGNTKLRWESTAKTDIGLDAALFNGKLNVTVDYFRTDISDMLLNAEVLRITGVPGASILTNIGEMSNTGFEIQLNSVNYRSHNGSFVWTSLLNFTYVKNKVKALAGDDIMGTNCLMVGKPMGVWRVYEWAGVDPQTGRPGYIDGPTGKVKYWDGDPAVIASQKWRFADGSLAPTLGTDDLKIFDQVSGTPTWYGNFDNMVQWKSFDFTVGLSYAGGNKILNATRAGLLTTAMGNKTTEILDRWTTPGQNTEIAKLYWNQNTGLTTSNSTRFLEDATFLRVRDITLGYSLPAKVSSYIGFSGRIYGRVSNLYTFTNYSGADPEISTNRNSNYTTGNDNRSVPNARIWTVGLNLNF